MLVEKFIRVKVLSGVYEWAKKKSGDFGQSIDWSKLVVATVGAGIDLPILLVEDFVWLMVLSGPFRLHYSDQVSLHVLKVCRSTFSAIGLVVAFKRIKAMGSTFSPQILVDKLTKLNNSQQSIETLSHWCIFHMTKAKQVVETWDRQFHCSPREQKLAFLYLANDILQNSRRKGAEFVGEFWRVLPEALRDVIENGDDFGRNAALRLINIWDDRKVFGSRGHILKEEFVGRQSENSPKNGRQFSLKLRQSVGNTLDKIVSGYEVTYGVHLDEDAVLSRCRNAISCLEKVEKDIGGDMSSGQLTGFLKELQGQHAVLRECIEQLTAVEASRATLVSHLREALHEQEFKLDQVRNQLQAANICQQLLNSGNTQLLDDQGLHEPSSATVSQGFVVEDRGREHSNAVVYTRQLPFPEKSDVIEDDPRKSTAAAMAAKLTVSTSSAQMLTYVLSSLAQEGVIGNPVKNYPSDHPSEKRPKLEADPSCVPPPDEQPPLPPFPHLNALQQNGTTTNQQLTADGQPPPPSSSPPPPPPLPPMPPYPMPQLMQAGPISTVPYNYGAPQQLGPSLPCYPLVAPPVTGMSPYALPPTFPGSEGVSEVHLVMRRPWKPLILFKGCEGNSTLTLAFLLFLYWHDPLSSRGFFHGLQVRPLFKDQKRIAEMADPRLQGQYPTRGLYQALAIAIMCVQEQPNLSPLVADAVMALDYPAS
ncbi:hypothetical protein Nepgr_025718 [Nepenthes gracilis]|uniref:CID domain-containing protein n=1 Tax=Nepenthes gracilis TaxID=150966 RepID=A0AAD3T6J5_NEPGR|nr:hypothetical protein Nepgr_025718 [Nepenthes gracilis]